MQSFDLAEPPAVVRVRVRCSVIRVRIGDTRVRVRVVVRATENTADGIFYLFSFITPYAFVVRLAFIA